MKDRIKPLSEMSYEELTAAINDPIGPDYKGYQDAARTMRELSRKK